MRHIRIHTRQPLADGARIELEQSAARHVVRVLRQRAGQDLVLFNGDGLEYAATITAAGPGDRCSVLVGSSNRPATESPLSISLVQGISRGDRMDWCIQKSCELGVTGIWPVFTARSGVQLTAKRAEKRVQHWQNIAISACEQSGRVKVPTVHCPVKLQDLDWPAGQRFYLDPSARIGPLEIQAPQDRGIVIVIGPEGGLAPREIDWLQHKDSTGLALGPRVLRTETAGPAAIAALQALFGDWK